MSAPKSRSRRGIYFLPSLLTVANIFCGFYSIVSSMKGDLELAAMLIGWAIVLDALDGRVARLANATSGFGKEFDSLADIVSFGVAPGVLAYVWALRLWPRVGWLACFLFLICGAMRLARFNIQKQADDKRFFVGMPIPAAGRCDGVHRIHVSKAPRDLGASDSHHRPRRGVGTHHGEHLAVLQLQGHRSQRAPSVFGHFFCWRFSSWPSALILKSCCSACRSLTW